MMTITVNGREEKLNIGCRTFVSLAELLSLLRMERQYALAIVNGSSIPHRDFSSSMIKSGDGIRLPETD
jgi:sulfur carrier protein ThiS